MSSSGCAVCRIRELVYNILADLGREALWEWIKQIKTSVRDVQYAASLRHR